jgi:prepilin-type N-terminal cleavage/methylation domain-containing protein
MLNTKRIRLQGFTLIELIVVIAILAVLSLLIFPQVVTFVTSSSLTVCQNNMATVIREYVYNNASPLDPPYNYEDHLSEICPNHGTVTGRIDPNTGALTLTCSKHGTLSSVDLDFTKNVVANVNNITRDVNGKEQSIVTYFKDHKTSVIDSESTTDNSLTGKINDYLKSNRLSTTDSTWQMKLENGNYVITVASKKLSTSDVGSSVVTTKYIYTSQGNYTGSLTGTSTVKKYSKNGDTYAQLDKFTETKTTPTPGN